MYRCSSFWPECHFSYIPSIKPPSMPLLSLRAGPAHSTLYLASSPLSSPDARTGPPSRYSRRRQWCSAHAVFYIFSHGCPIYSQPTNTPCLSETCRVDGSLEVETRSSGRRERPSRLKPCSGSTEQACPIPPFAQSSFSAPPVCLFRSILQRK